MLDVSPEAPPLETIKVLGLDLSFIYIYIAKDLIWWADLRLQDVEKQRERRKTKAKKAERRKKKKLGNMKNPHVFVGVFLGQFKL